MNDIQYVHEQLRIAHELIDVHNIMIFEKRMFKIRKSFFWQCFRNWRLKMNIDQNMLQTTIVSKNKQKNVRTLSFLMIRLMKIDTNLKISRFLKLQNFEFWNTKIKNFMIRTTHSILKKLKKNNSKKFFDNIDWCIKTNFWKRRRTLNVWIF